VVLELLVLYKLAKPGGKLMMKEDREHKDYMNQPRMMPRMMLRMMLWMMPWMRT